MTITSISLFRQWQPFRDGTYRCSGGRSAEGFDSTIVEIVTGDGAAGYGEMAPLGSFYDPAFAEGARAAMRELAPRLIGEKAAGIDAVNRRMELLLKGHPYAKSAIDMALWDLAGRRSGLSLATMTGGREGDSVPLYRSLAQETPEAMATRARKYIAEGYRRLQVKVGLDVREDIERLEAVRAAVPSDTVLFCDANGSWGTAETRQFLAATRAIDYALEQPCATYEENLAIRQAAAHPRRDDRRRRAAALLGDSLSTASPSSSRACRRPDKGAADPRCGHRAEPEDHHRGYRRRRNRHRRLFGPAAVDAGGAQATHGRLPQLGDGVERQGRFQDRRRTDVAA